MLIISYSIILFNIFQDISALNRVDTLMFHAVPGTPEGDELEQLSKMIEEYENRNAIIMSQSKVICSVIIYTYIHISYIIFIQAV